MYNKFVSLCPKNGGGFPRRVQLRSSAPILNSCGSLVAKGNIQDQYLTIVPYLHNFPHICFKSPLDLFYPETIVPMTIDIYVGWYICYSMPFQCIPDVETQYSSKLTKTSSASSGAFKNWFIFGQQKDPFEGSATILSGCRRNRRGPASGGCSR